MQLTPRRTDGRCSPSRCKSSSARRAGCCRRERSTFVISFPSGIVILLINERLQYLRSMMRMPCPCTALCAHSQSSRCDGDLWRPLVSNRSSIRHTVIVWHRHCSSRRGRHHLGAYRGLLLPHVLSYSQGGYCIPTRNDCVLEPLRSGLSHMSMSPGPSPTIRKSFNSPTNTFNLIRWLTFDGNLRGFLTLVTVRIQSIRQWHVLIIYRPEYVPASTRH